MNASKGQGVFITRPKIKQNKIKYAEEKNHLVKINCLTRNSKPKPKKGCKPSKNKLQSKHRTVPNKLGVQITPHTKVQVNPAKKKIKSQVSFGHY
jgi:hypothetical protein